MLMAVLTLPFLGYAQKAERSNVRKGNKQYVKKNFTEAEIDYRKALEVNPQSSEGNYNLGNTLFRQKKVKEALQAYQMALNKQTDPTKKAQIFHNAGTLLLATEQYEQAVDALKMSLRLNPNDNETRYNLALAQALLKKNPPKKDKKQDQKDDKKDDQKQQQQQQQQQQDDKEKQEQQNKKQQQQQQQEQVTKEKAKQLLDALSQDEKDTQEKVKRLQMQQSKPRKTDKDW